MADESNSEALASGSRNFSDFTIDTEFAIKLRSDQSADREAFFDYLVNLPPAATDMEIRSLSDLKSLTCFIQALTIRLQARKDFEAIQAYISVLIAAHGEVMLANEELRESLLALQTTQIAESKRLLDRMAYATGTLAFIRDAPL